MNHLVIQTNKIRSTKPVTILVLGANGFIGRYVVHGLKQTDHIVRAPNKEDINFAAIPINERQLSFLFKGVDVVINMVGVMSEDKHLLEQIHHYAPIQLANLAKKFHVKHWINLSALGADPTHKVAFVGSKGRGDAALLALADSHFKINIVRPSLVFGRGGASCEMFIKLARLPILILPNAGRQLIQPVHVFDVAQGLINLATQNNTKHNKENCLQNSQIINFTGNQTCTVADYLTMMRMNIHQKPPPTVLFVSNVLARVGSALIGPFIPSNNKAMISQDSLTLLEEGSTADNQVFTKLLKRPPLSYLQFTQYN